MSPIRTLLAAIGGLLLLAGALVAATGPPNLQPAPLLVAGGGLALVGLRWLRTE